MKTANKSWNLQSFLDSLVYELDQARETLAIKGVNRPLTYAVKDLSLDLQLFPEYDGDEVKFTTAKAGDTGASRVAITLGSITDRQIRETTKEPPKSDDIEIDEVEELDVETKRTLKKVGIKSVKDIEELEKKNIDLQKVPGVKKSNYGALADKLKRLRSKKLQARQFSEEREERKNNPPKVKKIHVKRVGDFAQIHLDGVRLKFGEFVPQAFLNGKPIVVIKHNDENLIVEADKHFFRAGNNELKIVLDDHSVVKLNLE